MFMAGATIPQLSVLDELWVELAVSCTDSLGELVRVARKHYNAHPGAAEAGVPSVGMVAFLLHAGEAGIPLSVLAQEIKENKSLVTPPLPSRERILGDAVQGARRFHLSWIRSISEAAGMPESTRTRLTSRGLAEYPPGQNFLQVPLDLDLVVAEVVRRSSLPELGQLRLTSIAAISSYAAATDPENAIRVEGALSGVVLKRNKFSSGISLVLSDGLDQIAVIARSGAPCLDAAKEIRVNDRIQVLGHIDRTRHGDLCLVTEKCQRLVSGDVLFQPDSLLDSLQRRGLPPRFTLGRAVHILEEVLAGKGFLRYEPSYISAALQAERSVEPLDVYFPGWGARTSLVPSPVPQLIRAGIGLGVPRIFATARVFTRTIRDGFTSPDSPAAFVFILGITLDEALDEIEDTVRLSVSRLLGDANADLAISPSPWERSDFSPKGIIPSQKPLFELGRRTQHPRGRGFDVTPISLVWPGGYVLVEGHIAHLGEDLSYAVVSLHIERMLQLLVKQDDGRRVRFHGPENFLANG